MLILAIIHFLTMSAFQLPLNIQPTHTSVSLSLLLLQTIPNHHQPCQPNPSKFTYPSLSLSIFSLLALIFKDLIWVVNVLLYFLFGRAVGVIELCFFIFSSFNFWFLFGRLVGWIYFFVVSNGVFPASLIQFWAKFFL